MVKSRRQGDSVPNMVWGGDPESAVNRPVTTVSQTQRPTSSPPIHPGAANILSSPTTDKAHKTSLMICCSI